MSTKIKCQCVSKEESQSYRDDNPISTKIKLQVPYDQNSIYFQLSGGTAIELNTVNQAAADEFKIGKYYDVMIGPSED